MRFGTDIPFPREALLQSKEARRLRISSLLSRREDLRGRVTVAFAKDVSAPSDTAFSIRRLPHGGWRLGVHVCDVNEFLPVGSPLERVAGERLASVPGGAEMLPPGFVKTVLSLEAGAERPALSVILDINADGGVQSITFYESVIRVAQLCLFAELDSLSTTADPSAVMPLREKYAAVYGTVAEMYELAGVLFNLRKEAGGLDHTRLESGIFGNGFEHRYESDSRAMLREIYYFVSAAVGRFMSDRGLPCLFAAQASLQSREAEKYCSLFGVKYGGLPARVARAAELAKGGAYFGFSCEVFRQKLPDSDCSAGRVYNAYANDDRVVRFFCPSQRYSDLLMSRVLKELVITPASREGAAMLRAEAAVSGFADSAAKAEHYICSAERAFLLASAQKYCASERAAEGYVFAGDGDNYEILLEYGVSAVLHSRRTLHFGEKLTLRVNATADGLALAEPDE